jgi:hypothetical protein
MIRKQTGSVLLPAVLLALSATVACTPAQDSARAPRYTLVMGIDVSGSFRAHDQFEEALEFAAQYVYAHMNGFGELEVPSSLFVGSVGGEEVGEIKAFHPIHDFQDKNPDEIVASLKEWFPEEDRLTDFNAFFARVAGLLNQRGLTLVPLNIVILSDGEPDLTPGTPATVDRFAAIDVSPLEYLARSVTVRVLYPEPTVTSEWEMKVKRRRVRMWTTDAAVMGGWKEQIDPELPLEEQAALWTWIKDNVDFRVRRSRIF